MRLLVKVLVAFAFSVSLGAGVAQAGEREDLVKQIIDGQLLDNNSMVEDGVKQMAAGMGADRANLTPDERTRLEAGLRKTLIEALQSLIQPVLSDPAKFSMEDLRGIATFNASPAGKKWNGLASAADVTSPQARATIAASLFRNVEPALFAKLVAASAPSGERRP